MAPLLLLLLLFGSSLHSSYSLPLCIDSSAPLPKQHQNQSFCGYEESTCCSSKDESDIEKEFQSLNISDGTCSSHVKSLLCAKCDPFSGNLFKDGSKIRTVPVLCNSTVTGVGIQSKDSGSNFCEQVWDACKDVEIRNSPFAPSLQGSSQVSDSSPSKLTDQWQRKDDFCNAFGSSSGNESVCFNGQTILINSTQTPPAPKGLCLDRLWDGSDMYVNFVPHPDGSDRVFVSNVAGKIWLTTIPEEGSGKTIKLDESNVFLDITDQVNNDPPFGVMGMAFHPNFASNGRFFVSYNCDQKQPGSCSGRCACNSDVDCDPSELPPDRGDRPCRHHAVIAEFTANGTSSSPQMASKANPNEVRRIFTMGLPSSKSHGGQILFGPADGYLYFMMGDGSQNSTLHNFAQNKKSPLGKIMRLDVDRIPSPNEVSTLHLWGNYSIPKDNPYVGERELAHEVWALGLRNPWRCSFDSERHSYFFCGDTGEDTYEEIDLISKGGNFGWAFYEGYLHYENLSSVNPNAKPADMIFPIMGYRHTTQSASISGGYVYRSKTDACMFGRYLYADLYAKSIYAGTEIPPNSGNYTSEKIPFTCTSDSPIRCKTVDQSTLPDLGFIFSFGEDNKNDVYILANNGIYRVSHPSRCNYTCPVATPFNGSSPGSGSMPSSSHLAGIPQLAKLTVLLLVLTLSLLS